eukprot:GFUD01007855.1.p1 GENE.GFUD01007855.1~~GFUD01007855.1.p1  ORF type:complete len:139 (+),score=43.40 GFUD01007855.1:42-458(+)
MAATIKALEGDWQYVSEKGYDPVKVTVKNIMGSDWMVACMIPKGNSMVSMLKRDEGGKFSLVKLNCTNRECPKENKELEAEFKIFLEQGISNLLRDGKNLIIEAGGKQKQLVEDDVMQKHNEAQKAKLASAKGSGRFG